MRFTFVNSFSQLGQTGNMAANGGSLEPLTPSDSPVDDRQSSPAISTQTTLLPAFTPSFSMMSPQRPTFPSPVSKTAPSPLSRTGWKRQRVQQKDDNFTQALEDLKENRLVLQKQLERPEDAIRQLEKMICYMLRKVPEEDQYNTMHKIYNLLYGRMKRRNVNT